MFNEWDAAIIPKYTPGDPEKEEAILKLGARITDRYAVKFANMMKTDDPEFWALNAVLTKEEAIFLERSFPKLRTGHSVEELAKTNNMTVEETQKMCEHLGWIGIIESVRDNPEGRLEWSLPVFVPGSAEFMVMNDELTDQHPELLTFFNLMTQMPLENITQMVAPGGSGIGMHVIPVEKAIETCNESVSIEHISHWLDKYEGKIGVGICTCRKQQAIRGEGTGAIGGDWCIGLGDLAEFTANRGMGRYITKEEALEILERAERKGYVHQTTNIDGENKIVAICNCAPGVCNAIRTSQLYNTPNLSRSAYRSHVDKEKCVACGKCVEVCPVGAVKLGQKLCDRNGCEIEYPLTKLPDTNKWSCEEWNINYRDDAKINCYDSGTAPCKSACPAHLAVQGYINMAGEGRWMEALKLIKKDNPFPAVCGDVCNKRCEEECTRGTFDEPVAIDEIKKAIAAKELNENERYIPLCENDFGEMWGPDYKMAIIGAGPAGLSCAYYLREQGYDVTVFDKEKRPGGMMMNGIPNFRLEKDVVKAEIDVLEAMGVEFRCGVEVGVDVTIDDLRKEGYKAFYLAIGLQNGGKLDVPGDDAIGVMSGIDFVKDVNLNDSGKLSGRVVVIGGGNIGADIARTAIRSGADSVDLFCLESCEAMPMGEEDRIECEEEGITIHAGWGPIEITKGKGKTNLDKCTGIKFQKCLCVLDENGKFNPAFDESETQEYKCSTIIYCIGQKPEWKDLLKGTNVELTPRGTVVADPVTFQTGEADIFAGGDAYTGQKFVIDAVAEGKLASESMHRFVHFGQSLTLGRDLREFGMLDKDNIDLSGYDHAYRQVPGKKPGKPEETFANLREPLTDEQVLLESERCLHCGASTVDLNRCIGCGLCTTRCEFDAIHLSRDLPENTCYVRTEDKMKSVGPYAAKRAVKIVFTDDEGRMDGKKVGAAAAAAAGAAVLRQVRKNAK